MRQIIFLWAFCTLLSKKFPFDFQKRPIFRYIRMIFLLGAAMNLIRENGKEDCGNIKLIGSQVYQAPYVCPTTQRFWKSIILVVFKNVRQEMDQAQGFPFNVNAFPILSVTFDWIFWKPRFYTVHFYPPSWYWHQNLAIKSFHYCCVGRFSIRGLMHDPRSVSKVAGNTEQGSASDLFQPL